MAVVESADPSSAEKSGNAHVARDVWTPIELILLGAIWGSSFLFMRIAAADFGPLPLVEVRLVAGVAILLPFLWRARSRITRKHWLRFALIGSLNSAIPFSLFAWGAERAPAGIGAIANSMTALFAALVAFLVFGERIGSRRAIALVVGFVGVVILASGRTAGDNVAGAAIAGTVASLCYGLALNFTRHWLADLPPVVGVAGTLTCATLIALPLAIATWPAMPIPVTSWAAATLLGVVCTGFAYWLFFRLIQRVGAPRASTTTYLVPIFGVAWGWLLLGEQPTWTMVASAVLILGSVILSQREVQRAPS
ncbi:MAG TPA: DMT family transporter [Rhodanobacteraceae bacterium]|jgi:drug/metabolite transporter (DMT)-like permease|nr:DMT family transporter [Rhodanobacteraceae bacterium]